MKKLLILISCVLLLACGFHLRGLANIPFKSLHVISPSNHAIKTELKRSIENGSETIVIDSPQDAEAILHIISANHKRHILSVSGSGRVREFQLRYLVTYRISNSKGQELVPTSNISISRILPYSDQQVLSKQEEEKMLVREMRKDAARQIVYRLGKIKN